MKQKLTAVIQKTDNWWIGWIAEIPGVNSQGATKTELLANLKGALIDTLEYNREKSLKKASVGVQQVALHV